MRDTRRHVPPLNGTPVDCHVAPDGLRSADMRLKIPQATGWGAFPSHSIRVPPARNFDLNREWTTAANQPYT